MDFKPVWSRLPKNLKIRYHSTHQISQVQHEKASKGCETFCRVFDGIYTAAWWTCILLYKSEAKCTNFAHYHYIAFAITLAIKVRS